MYKKVWLAFVDIRAKKGNKFSDLIDLNGNLNDDYIGAWGNILVISDKINDVPKIIKAGLNELGMVIRFIDKIENVDSLIEYGELKSEILEEANWLISSTFIFKISDKLFPYLDYPPR